MKGMLTFLRHVCACKLRELVALLIVGKEFRVDLWKVGGLKFDSG
jgi:hypothetical protein